MGRAGMSAERLKAAAQKRVKTIGAEGRKAAAQKRVKTMGAEGLYAAAQKRVKTMGAEGRKAAAQKRAKTMGEVRLSAAYQKRLETMGAEGLYAAGQKGAATRAAQKTAASSQQQFMEGSSAGGLAPSPSVNAQQLNNVETVLRLTGAGHSPQSIARLTGIPEEQVNQILSLDQDQMDVEPDEMEG